MYLFYSIRTRVYEELFLKHEPDPMGDATGVLLRSQRRYVALAMIPFLPIAATPKVVEAESPGSRQPIPVLLWSENMKQEADLLLARAGSWWRYGWFIPLLFAVLAAFAVYGATSATSLKNLELQQAAYFLEPQVGDVIIVTDRKNPADYHSDFRTAYRIVGVDEEYIYARRSTETKAGDFKLLEDMPKIAKTFTVTESVFTGPEERFSRAMYNHRSGLHSLQDVSIPHDQRGYDMPVGIVLRLGEN